MLTATTVRRMFWEKAYNTPRHDVSFWQTEGVKANAEKLVNLQLTGLDFYEFIRLMVESAKNQDDFDRIRKFVLYVDEFKRQAREQGF